MLRIIAFILLSLIAVGCGAPRYIDYFPYHDDGTPKPKLAIMPIMDNSQNSLAWDLTEEISDGIYYELMSSGEVYMVSPKEMGQGWSKKYDIDFFSNDISYVKDFQNTDFIISMEIIDRKITACDLCVPNNLTLFISIRIKILDIRFCEPKIVLYEVFRTDYTGIQTNAYDENNICWKDQTYLKTYCGRAHQSIICSLSKRIEKVIWSVK
jgi:hypothetical protein